MTGSRFRRRLIGSVAALLLTGSILGAPASFGFDNNPNSAVVAFEAQGEGYGVAVNAIVSQALPIPVDAFVLHSLVSADATPRAQATAGPVDVPVTGALGLLGVPIGVPTSCTAFFPGAPASADCGVVPGSAATVGQGHADASGDPSDQDLTATKASAATSISSVNEPLVSVSVADSTSSAGFGDSGLTVASHVALGDINLSEGVVSLTKVSSDASAVANGQPGMAQAASQFSVVGGSIAGLVPFKVTTQGIVFTIPNLPAIPVVGIELPLPAGTDTVPAPLAAALAPLDPILSSMLGPAGLTMTVLPASTKTTADGTSAQAVSEALAIAYRIPGQSTGVKVTVGGTSASAYAVTSPPDTGTTSPGPAAGPTGSGATSADGIPAGPSAPVVGATPSLGPSNPGGTTAGPAFASAAPSNPSAAPPSLGQSGNKPSNLPVAAVLPLSKRFRLAYGLGAIAALVFLVGWVAIPGRDSGLFAIARKQSAHSN